MEQTARPKRVECVVLGRGMIAATLALLLAEQGKTVALLVERRDAGGDPVSPHDDATLTALYERVASFEKCHCVVGTWVRGISVIENVILGAIAEDARYDSRIVVNASQDERHAAYARMMRQPKNEYSGAARIAPATVMGGWQMEGTLTATTDSAAIATDAAAQITA
jgi:glycine/D-amino acid oxidase-like deaminating enzyme